MWSWGLREGSLKLARAAIQHGADVNELAQTEDNCFQLTDRGPLKTALIEAGLSDFPEMVTLLLNHGADPGLVSHCGISPMRAAKFWKGEYIAVTLRARGVSGFPDADGDEDAEAVAVPNPVPVAQQALVMSFELLRA